MNEITEPTTFTDGESTGVTVTSDTPAPDFAQLAFDVKFGRDDLDEIKTALTQATAAMEATPEFKRVAELVDAKREAQDRLAAREQRLREAALAQYAATNEKRFVGVSVRITRRLEYDRTEALQYVSNNLPALLSFDAKQFERFALAVLDAKQPLAFVTVKEEPTAAIATKIEA